MFCHPKSCCHEKSTLEKLSAAALLIGGLAATVYYGYKLMEKLKCKCQCHNPSDMSAPPDTASHDYDHISENDCLCHDQKDYYGQCGCFDTEEK